MTAELEVRGGQLQVHDEEVRRLLELLLVLLLRVRDTLDGGANAD